MRRGCQLLRARQHPAPLPSAAAANVKPIPLHLRRLSTGSAVRRLCHRYWQVQRQGFCRALSTQQQQQPHGERRTGGGLTNSGGGISGSAGDEKTDVGDDNDDVLVYQGKRSGMLRFLKTCSFVNCTASLVSVPLIVTADIAMPFTARVSMATTVALFGLSTTGFLAWVSKPYLLKMVLRPAQQELVLETVNIMGRVRTTVIPLQPLPPQPTGRSSGGGHSIRRLRGATFDKGDSLLVNPFSTFMLDTAWYYIDAKGTVHRPDVLEKLLGAWPPPESPPPVPEHAEAE
jgi:hypothetical protein